MAAIASLIFLPAYGLLVLIWLSLNRAQHRQSKWVGLAAIACAGPAFYGVGVFATWFQLNTCYSSVIQAVADLPGFYLRTNSSSALDNLSTLVKNAGLEGYETNCHALQANIEKLKTAPSGGATNAAP